MILEASIRHHCECLLLVSKSTKTMGCGASSVRDPMANKANQNKQAADESAASKLARPGYLRPEGENGLTEDEFRMATRLFFHFDESGESRTSAPRARSGFVDCR